MHVREPPAPKPGWARLLSAGFLVVGVTFTVLYAVNVTRPSVLIDEELGPCTKGKGFNRREIECSEYSEIWAHVLLLGLPLTLVGLGLMFARLSFKSGR